MSLAAIHSATAELAARGTRDPLRYWVPTPPQRAWLSDAAPIKLFRAANQLGKTSAQCAEVHWRCLGTHPYLTVQRPPIEAWIICHSWEQSLSIQSKFWELAPRSEIDASVEYVPGKGFRGKTPIVLYKNGSLVRIKTTNQGTLGLASATVGYIGIDEPPTTRIWGELMARVLHGDGAGTSGTIGLTMTPVGAPVGWLRKLVEDGIISDHQAALTVENMTPIGGRPMLTQAQIERMSRNYLPIDRAQRMEGAWEGSTADRVFTAFGDSMISSLPLPAKERDEDPYRIAIGIDHGSDAGSQVAVLVAVDKSSAHPSVYVLDEYIAGAAKPEAHARAILAMLNRNGMTHHNVDKFVGDRAYGGKRSGGKMSNMLLGRGFEIALGMPHGRLPFRIKTAWKPRYSVYSGCQQLHEIMERDNFLVHPRCKQLIRSLMHWTFRDDEHKHSLDALRYSALTLIDDRIRAPVKIRMYR